ncbi:ornithine--oxo-acid transaminase [Limimonas halophila]|uniref:ornithine aminotransferase n=1 Tax=Limimonas halophila TaxID=1082479 RepID=A0A1G7UUE5_9PROT|nr:ornithine--oxo-acid transaminase [Limimonas halophila]SDG50360.1 ornithine--oxo-acid transaminase [Limimonas halophila]
MTPRDDATDPAALAERYGAPNYKPLPVTLARAEGVWAWDTDGRRYLDCLAAYSALNHGHRHPRILAALSEQAERLTLTARAFHNDRLGPFLKKLCATAGAEMALPMNTGAEAVETAIKAARRWGHQARGIPDGHAEIVVARGAFHGRTLSGISASTDPEARAWFGPYAPGFVIVPFGDAAALEAAITPNTAAVMVEPIQGEGGIVVPPEGYLEAVRAACDRHGVLFIADEIQTGLGRTGRLFCHQHEAAAPDLMQLGKALGGGVYPVSAVVGSADVLGRLTPGSHGSTFGGNPLACAVGEAALDALADEELPARSARLGGRLLAGLRAIDSPRIAEARGRGLMVGLELTEPARPVCEALLARGVLCKDTRDTVIRLTPPLVIGEAEVDWLVAQIHAVLASAAAG